MRVHAPAGLHGVHLPVLWLLQQHHGCRHWLLLQHPPGLSLHRCLLLHLLSHLHHCTVCAGVDTLRRTHVMLLRQRWLYCRYSVCKCVSMFVCVFTQCHWQKQTNQLSINLYSASLTAGLHSMGTAVRVAVATGGGATGSYSRILFTGWDFGCQGDRATKLKQKSILYQFQVRDYAIFLVGDVWFPKLQKPLNIDHSVSLSLCLSASLSWCLCLYVPLSLFLRWI